MPEVALRPNAIQYARRPVGLSLLDIFMGANFLAGLNS